jgi:hypothetical protein
MTKRDHYKKISIIMSISETKFAMNKAVNACIAVVLPVLQLIKDRQKMIANQMGLYDTEYSC